MVDNRKKAKACELKFGSPYLKNTKEVWVYVKDYKPVVTPYRPVGAEAVAILADGVAFCARMGFVDLGAKYSESLKFAIDNPTAFVPNPNYDKTKKEFKPIEFNACMG